MIGDINPRPRGELWKAAAAPGVAAYAPGVARGGLFERHTDRVIRADCDGLIGQD